MSLTLAAVSLFPVFVAEASGDLSVTASKGSAALVGDKGSLEARLYGTFVDADFSSSNSDVIFVNGSQYIAEGPGTATITATYTEWVDPVDPVYPDDPDNDSDNFNLNSGASNDRYAVTHTGTIKITVSSPQPVGEGNLRLSPSSREISVGGSAGFTATYNNPSVYPANSDVTSKASWTTSDSSVAYYDSNGNFIGRKAGYVTITATYADVSDSAHINVVAASKTPQSISLSPVTRNISVGETGAFSAILRYTDGSTADVTNSCTWTSGNSKIAASLGSGNFVGYLNGNTYVKATWSVPGGSFAATSNLYVGPTNIDTLVISPSATSSTIGSVTQFRALVNHTDGRSPSDVTNASNWSLDRAIAMYNGNGSYTATGIGTTTVNATYVNNGNVLTAHGTYSVSGVTPPAPSRPSNASFTIGSTAYYIDGMVNYAPVATYTFGGRTYVPQRPMAAAVGVSVSWDNASQSATFTDPANGTVVVLKLGSPYYTVNGVQQPKMDVAPRMVGSSLTCPARYLATAFGYQVSFDKVNNAVNLTR